MVSLVNLVFETYPENTSFILDAEIVAIDRDGNFKSFQELSNRPRKSVELHEVRVSVCVFAFDLMYSNGEVSALKRRIFNLFILCRYCWGSLSEYEGRCSILDYPPSVQRIV